MTGVNDLAKLVPGFDFLQGLMKNAGAATGIPGMGQWVAPTLDPDELDKRIQELKTVQFWLDNNAKLLGVTIQALEVQRMTLSTLKTMNLPMADLREALKIKPAVATPASPFAGAFPPFSAAPAAAANRGQPDTNGEAEPAPAGAAARRGADAAAAPAAIDPMQWWSALTQQFAELATRAVKDGGAALGSVAGSQAGAATSARRPARAAKKAAAAPRKRR